MENKKPLIVDSGLKGIKLNLIKEALYVKEKDKKVIAKDEQGEIRYTRNDIVGLMGLLSRFDSRLHTMKDYKMWIKIRDNLKLCFLDDVDILEVSLDEASFLKTYLTELTTKDSKDQPLVEFEIRSLVGVLEQFENK